MGQAVDLPDPLEAPATPAGNSSADDLLSQLAGEEIDRLLAESDAESAAQIVAPPPAMEVPAVQPPAAQSPAAQTSIAQPPAALQVDEGLEAQLDKVLAEAASGASRSAIETSSVIDSPDSSAFTTPTGSTEVQISAEELDASLAAQATTPLADANQSAAAKTEVRSAVSDIETSLQERGGLNDSSAGDVTVDPTDDEATIPIYLRPLVWLNAPLMFLPEPIREALGKIAILTTFNAAAIIAYVMIFRRHHH